MSKQMQPTVEKLIRGTNGKFFHVEFTKRDGSLRKMTARIGVKKHLKGIGMSHNPTDLGHIIVWDTTKKAYRTVDTRAVSYFRAGHKEWGHKS